MFFSVDGNQLLSCAVIYGRASNSRRVFTRESRLQAEVDVLAKVGRRRLGEEEPREGPRAFIPPPSELQGPQV